VPLRNFEAIIPDFLWKQPASLSHAEVIQQYKEVDQLPADERSTVIKVVAALLRDYRTRQAYAG